MHSTDVLRCAVWENCGLWIAARIRGDLGVNITQASLTAISYTVYDLANDNAVIAGPTSVSISTDVFDVLQTTDPRWVLDTIGYNFATALPGSCFPVGGQDVRVEFLFVPVSGADFVFVAQVHVQDLYTF